MNVSKIRFPVLTALIALPIIVYAILVYHFTVNIPAWDDYDAVLSYLNQTGGERFHRFFSQHNEHRIAFMRLVVEGVYRLSGGIDFRSLVYIGNLSLLILFILLLTLFPRENRVSMVSFVPVSYFLFQAQLFENMTWASTSLTFNVVLLFALLSLYFWSKNTPSGYGLALVFGILAAYTLGSGLFLFINLVIWELSKIVFDDESNMRDKVIGLIRPQRTVLFIVTSILFYLYFSDYVKPEHHPSIGQALLSPYILIKHFFAFLGSCFTTTNPAVAILAGFIESVLFLFLTCRRYQKKNPVGYYFLLFLFSCAFAAGICRSGFGPLQALSSRYRLISILILVFEYLAIVELYADPFKSKKVILFVLLLPAVAFNITSSTLSTPYLAERKEMLVQGLENWRLTGHGLNYPDEKKATSILRQALEKGYYRPQTLRKETPA